MLIIQVQIQYPHLLKNVLYTTKKIFISQFVYQMKKKNPWIVAVMAQFRKGKKSNPNYKYGQAIKDAKKTYKKK